jgi:hypothetical protein
MITPFLPLADRKDTTAMLAALKVRFPEYFPKESEPCLE